MDGMDKKIRCVRCAKCLKVLIELVHVPVYQCGGCGTLLQSKYYLASKDVQVNEVDRQQNSCEQEENESKLAVSKTDQLAFTSIPETTDEDHGDKSTEIEMESFLNEDTEESTQYSQQDSDSSLLCGKLGEVLNTYQHASENSMEYSFESEQDESIQVEDGLNEDSDNPPKVSQSGSSPSLMTERLEESPEPFIQTVGSEEEFLSEVQENGCRESFIDNKMDAHPTPKLQENAVKSLNNRHMHRFFSNKEALSSSSVHISREERGVSLDSGNFYSVQDWLNSECPTGTVSRRTTFNGDSCNHENGNTSTKFENLGQDNTELLRKVKELSHQLSNLYGERDWNSRSHIRVPPQQPLFDNHNYGLEFSKNLNPNLNQYPLGGYYRSRTSGPQYYPLEDHRLQFQPNLCHSGSRRAYAYNMRSRPSSTANPRPPFGSSIPPCCSENHMHNLDMEKTVYRERKQTLMRHCRPLSGAAPFVICNKCLELLQLPADFLISRKRMQKLKCGGCSKVILLSFQAGARTTQKSLSPPKNVPGGNRLSMSEDGLSFSQNYSPETAPAQSILASSSEKKRVKDSPNLALHRLMGYSSATEILCQPSDVDEGYETAQPIRHS